MSLEKISGIPVEISVDDSCNIDRIDSCCRAAMLCFDRLNISRLEVDCPGFDPEKGCQGFIQAYDRNDRQLNDVGGPIAELRKQAPGNFSYSQ